METTEKTYQLNSCTVTTPALNNGKPTEICYTIPLIDVETQMREIYEYKVYKPFKKKNKIILDIGANIGLASLYLKDFADKVYAFEPNPIMFHALKKNVAPYGNIEAINKAVYILDGEHPIIAKEGEIPQSLYYTNPGPISTQVIESVRIDTFVKDWKIEHIDLIKMDIEGGEYNLIMDKSFRDVLPKIEAMVGELHVTGGQYALFPDVAMGILRQYGFDFKYIKTPLNNLELHIGYQNPFDGNTNEYTINLWSNFKAKKHD